jgi:hypothetical protein
MDVEKCHDEVGVEDRTGRELTGEDSTKGTWIHASPFWRTGRGIAGQSETGPSNKRPVGRSWSSTSLGLENAETAHGSGTKFTKFPKITKKSNWLPSWTS